MTATAQAFAGPPETDDRKQDGSQLDVEALLRQAMGGGAGDGRFGVRGPSANADTSFSVPSAGTTPPPRTSAAPMTPAEPQPPNPYIQPDPSKAPANLATATLTPNQVQKPPTGSNNANLVEDLRQRAMLGNPTDPNAVDSAGKSKYHMGIGQRILGTVANFANGFARDGAAPIYVGPGATALG
jgi:hypothetical protein